ncbi:hypothetical protein E2562_005103 [Oryza meyeriana var. granulata]|uniref:Uncharacterized protein n=1 Tax=Oryza meyeriana var. granulata TaxID=110450 RepID=A0A6G1BTJ0_9ORYZ|nr:hypothetical protein E2562_005103 [Oryza meyeriana var. granulata]
MLHPCSMQERMRDQFRLPISRDAATALALRTVLILNNQLAHLRFVWLGRSTMSDTSKSVPPEQLPPEQLPLEELHQQPMPVINLGHLSLDDPMVRSWVVDDIAKACRYLGYFQLTSPLVTCATMVCGELV